MEILCKGNSNFLSKWLERKKCGTSEGCLFRLEKFPFDLCIPFAFQLVKPEFLAKWKAPLHTAGYTMWNVVSRSEHPLMGSSN